MHKIRARVGRILNWLESVFKTDVRYIARGFSWSIATQICIATFSLALSILVSRYVPREAYGEYKYILTVVNLLTILSLNNIGGAVLQSTARGFEGALPQGFRLNLRWSILVFGGSLALGGYYFLAHNFTLALGILIGGCLTPFITSVNLFSNFLAGKKDFRRMSLYSGIVGTGVPVLALIATAVLSPTPLSLVLAYFISNIIADSYLYLRTLRIYAVDRARTDPQMLSYGKHLSVMGVLAGVVGNIDQFLLFHFIGPIQVAIYAFAIGIFDQVKGPLKMLDSMTQARFASRDATLIRENMRTKVLVIAGVALFISAAFIVIAPYLYRFLFPAYMDAIPYAQIYALTLFGTTVQGPAYAYFVTHKKVREQYAVTVGSSIIQLTFITIGILYGGLLGLVVARVLASLANCVLTFVQYHLSKDTSLITPQR
ncbi:MAG: hypothetical protein JWL88_406 [Parcubacteria group bacterium]|nr:hypothetical protein [Parcubacteria group bacterium]